MELGSSWRLVFAAAFSGMARSRLLYSLAIQLQVWDTRRKMRGYKVSQELNQEIAFGDDAVHEVARISMMW